MATLADMKARIAEEIFRDDLGSAIAREITSAIKFYQRQRFWFDESREIVFPTVPGQEFYGSAADVRIPSLIRIDYVQATQNTRPMTLDMASPEILDLWSGTPSAGPPSSYSYFQGRLRLYPVPNEAYPVRIAAHYRVEPPATDTEDDNPWMNEAEELIRSRAKRNLYLHSLGDQAMGAVMKAAEDEALAALRIETSARTQVTNLQPDCF